MLQYCTRLQGVRPFAPHAANCAVCLAFAGDSTSAASVTDIKLEASDLHVTLSPDVLELGTRLAASALEPLMQVGAACCFVV